MKTATLMLFLVTLTGCSQYQAAKDAVTIGKRAAGITYYERVCDLTYGTEKYVIIKKQLSHADFRTFCKRSEAR
jgi:hypothetical protein